MQFRLFYPSKYNIKSDVFHLIKWLNYFFYHRQVEKFGNSSENFDIGQLFQAFGSFLGIFLGSIAIGALVGCINALFTKFTKIREMPNLETAIFILISYSTFLATEAARLSGLLICLKIDDYHILKC